MYTGWTATSGESALVCWMMSCATSQASSWLLSVYTRMPVHPALSLQRATSMTRRRYPPSGAPSNAGQVENSATGVSGCILDPPSAGAPGVRRRPGHEIQLPAGVQQVHGQPGLVHQGGHARAAVEEDRTPAERQADLADRRPPGEQPWERGDELLARQVARPRQKRYGVADVVEEADGQHIVEAPGGGIGQELVADEPAPIGDPGLPRFLLGDVEHVLGKVQPHHLACAALGQRDRILAGSTAHVQDRLASNGFTLLHCALEPIVHVPPEDPVDQPGGRIDGVKLSGRAVEVSEHGGHILRSPPHLHILRGALARWATLMRRDRPRVPSARGPPRLGPPRHPPTAGARR